MCTASSWIPESCGIGLFDPGLELAPVEFLLGPLTDNPRQVGHQLQRELSGLWSARRGAYRVIYEIDDEDRTVFVLRIEHRSDVYRPR